MHLAFHDSERREDDRGAGWPTLRFPGYDSSASESQIINSNPQANPSSPSVPGPAVGEAAAPPIGPEHLQALQEANTRAKKIKRAVAVAGFNGWSIAIMAAFSGLAAIFSPSSLIIALALAFIATMEFRGRNALRRLDPKAAPQLGWNQVLFASLIVLYAMWGSYQTLSAPALSAQYAEYGTEVAGMMQPFDSVVTTATMAFYGAVAIFGVLFQGGTALYYFSRQKHLAQYVQSTPRWIIELQRQQPSF